MKLAPLLVLTPLLLLGLAPQPPHDAPVLPPAAAPAAAAQQAPAPTIRFQAIDIYIDSGETPLAAYQVEIRAAAASATLVGVEGGEAAPFRDPPHYDAAALHENRLVERIILAAYTTAAADKLPTGRTRVARIHVQVTGDPNAEPQYHSDLMAAGDADGQRIPATLHLEPVQNSGDQQ
jgi:hypothetical protein